MKIALICYFVVEGKVVAALLNLCLCSDDLPPELLVLLLVLRYDITEPQRVARMYKSFVQSPVNYIHLSYAHPSCTTTLVIPHIHSPHTLKHVSMHHDRPEDNVRMEVGSGPLHVQSGPRGHPCLARAGHGRRGYRESRGLQQNEASSTGLGLGNEATETYRAPPTGSPTQGTTVGAGVRVSSFRRPGPSYWWYNLPPRLPGHAFHAGGSFLLFEI